MTQEEKAKAYDEALERARALNNGEAINIKIGTTTCEYIFPELKESEDERIRKELIDFVKSRLAGFPECGRFIAWFEKQDIFSKKDIDDAYLKGVTDAKNEIEKQYEANYQIRKDIVIKPKFHKGDWITIDKDKPCQIISMDDKGNYIAQNCDDEKTHILSKKFCESYFHLWTIQDAKDGDVLFHSDSASNGIFIFKGILQRGNDIQEVICYCDYDSEDGFCLGEYHTCCWADSKILYPATKERRDLLFSKMKEAGYEWDADNKELKRVLIK